MRVARTSPNRKVAPSSLLVRTMIATGLVLSIGSALGENIHNLRVMVIIPEIHITRRIPDPAGETEVVRKLTENGFRVVDPRQAAIVRENRQRMQEILGDPVAAALLGLEYGADILVYGEAFSEAAPDQYGMRVCRARVEARAIRCDTGEILAAHGFEASGADVAEFVAAKKGLRAAGGKIADYFIDQFVNRVDSPTAPLGVTVMITGVKFTQVNALEKALRDDFWGLESVRRQNYSRGLAELHITFRGSMDSLVGFLTSAFSSEFALCLDRQTTSTIELTVCPRGELYRCDIRDITFDQISLVVESIRDSVSGVVHVLLDSYEEGAGVLFVEHIGPRGQILNALVTSDFGGFWLGVVEIRENNVALIVQSAERFFRLRIRGVDFPLLEQVEERMRANFAGLRYLVRESFADSTAVLRVLYDGGSIGPVDFLMSQVIPGLQLSVVETHQDNGVLRRVPE